MTKKERAEQRRITVKAIRRELRRYAAAKRRQSNGDHTTDTNRDRDHGLSSALSMKALAAELGILRYWGEPIEQRLNAAIDAKVTRRPFVLKAAA